MRFSFCSTAEFARRWGDEAPEEVLAGQRVRLLVKDDGDHYFQLERGRSLNLGGLVNRMRRRMRSASEEPKATSE